MSYLYKTKTYRALKYGIMGEYDANVFAHSVVWLLLLAMFITAIVLYHL